MHGDGGGLFLKVSSKTARSWLFLYRSGDKRTELGLGPYPSIGLSRARELAAELRTARAEGIDPKQARDKKRERSVTFASCAEEMLSDLSPGWSERYRYSYRRSLMVEAVALHDMPIATISTDDVLRVLQPLWLTREDNALRLRMRIEKLFDWAKARALRQGENAARWRGHLANLLPKQNRIQHHYAAMPYQDVPAFLAELRGVSGYGARGFELLILTATRSIEVIGAEWSEFDLDAKVWAIPPQRMKGRREHRIPLSDQTVEVLNALAAIRRGPFLLPSYDANQHAHRSLLDHVIRRLGHDCTVHGFRSSFADFAREQTAAKSETIELCLSHSIGPALVKAYNRTDLFQMRTALMQQWATFCCTPFGGNVVSLRR
jgi:integrase